MGVACTATCTSFLSILNISSIRQRWLEGKLVNMWELHTPPYYYYHALLILLSEGAVAPSK